MRVPADVCNIQAHSHARVCQGGVGGSSGHTSLGETIILKELYFNQFTHPNSKKLEIFKCLLVTCI